MNMVDFLKLQQMRSKQLVLVIGGYGNFGSRLSHFLAKSEVSFIIAGRNEAKATALKNNLTELYPNSLVSTALLDIHSNSLLAELKTIKPFIVVNACGPYIPNHYDLAEQCIKAGVHYIDLADNREFVVNITSLDKKAVEKNICVISGLSTVPALSSVVVEHFSNEFSVIDSLKYGISPGQKTEKGLSTVKSVLSYIGKPLKEFKGCKKTIYGWQDIYCQKYPELGKRWMANCDIPDLDLFPERYAINHIQFSAGMESTLLHFCIWLLSWLVRLEIPLELSKYSRFLLKASRLFNAFGSTNGGMHLLLKGKDLHGKPLEKKWFLIAKNNSGPNIPIMPAVIIIKKIINNEIKITGALPGLGLFTLEDFMNEVRDLEIKQYVI